MKVTLRLSDGREMTVSEVESITIDEQKIPCEATKQEQTTAVVKDEQNHIKYEIATTPTEGKAFEVDFSKINKVLFDEKSTDQRQEETRQRILAAFEEAQKNPEKYAEPFYTYMPIKTWKVKTGKELEEEATRLGDYNGYWVEQALEWAQRISNGESWEDVCNKPDKAKWYRWVIGPNGERWLVGGSVKHDSYKPASDVVKYYFPVGSYYDTVPFVVLRKKVALSTDY